VIRPSAIGAPVLRGEFVEEAEGLGLAVVDPPFVGTLKH
jgi:hypothetical protein